MIAMGQPGLDNRPEILKLISKQFSLDFGVYAAVVSTGTLSAGERVEIVSQTS